MGCLVSKPEKKTKEEKEMKPRINKRKIDTSADGISKRIRSTERFQTIIHKGV